MKGNEEVRSRNQILFETANYYFKNNKPVHIKLITGTFVNGMITFLEGDRLLIMDNFFGEMLILFDNIKDDGVVPYKEKGE